MGLPPPEQGQLVDVRNRRFVVTDVRRSAIASADPLVKPQHLVSLSSVDDEGLGDVGAGIIDCCC